MKKKLFRSFIVSLFVFTLFISVSKAEIAANIICTPSSATQYSVVQYSASDLFPAYTNESFIALLETYRNDSSEQNFNEIWSLFNNLGYGNVWIQSLASGRINMYAYSNEHDFGVGMSTDNVPLHLITDNGFCYDITLKNDNSLTIKSATMSANNNGVIGHRLDCLSGIERYKLVKDAKKLSIVSTKLYYETYQWDGVSYYEQAPSEPEVPEPDFEGISDDEKALIINSVVNLDDFKNIVPKKYRNQYFIVYEPSIQRFKVYFYPEQYYLKGRRFAEGEVDDISYESYKIIAFDSTNFIWDLWQSINPFDYYVFSGFLDEDNVFAPQFYGYENSHDLNQYYFSVYDEPIVYSSRDIGFVIYDITNNEYSDDAENSIITAPLVDSSGEEITITIPEEEGPESIGFWDSFLLKLKTLFTDLFSYLGALIEFLLNKLFDLPAYLLEQYGENVFTLLFAIIVKALEVLVSSISLLFRFASFLLTLVAIPADSTLFNVAVDGSAWGTNFIKGLDFLKGLSWNNLNFWRLFEWFVASLEVIWTVRIVRRHYSSIM